MTRGGVVLPVRIDIGGTVLPVRTVGAAGNGGSDFGTLPVTKIPCLGPITGRGIGSGFALEPVVEATGDAAGGTGTAAGITAIASVAIGVTSAAG
jgi:hypothetical protein